MRGRSEWFEFLDIMFCSGLAMSSVSENLKYCRCNYSNECLLGSIPSLKFEFQIFDEMNGFLEGVENLKDSKKYKDLLTLLFARNTKYQGWLCMYLRLC